MTNLYIPPTTYSSLQTQQQKGTQHTKSAEDLWKGQPTVGYTPKCCGLATKPMCSRVGRCLKYYPACHGCSGITPYHFECEGCLAGPPELIPLRLHFNKGEQCRTVQIVAENSNTNAIRYYEMVGPDTIFVQGANQKYESRNDMGDLISPTEAP